MKYIIELLSKETLAEGTMAFRFKKPEGLEFKAGQNFDFFLIDPPEMDAEGNKRTFSIVNAPHESDIVFATRMRDTAWKRVIKNAEPGFTLEMEGPYGDFVLHQKESRKAIMLVGGIGITPFMSMVKDATKRKLPHTIALFYSNRRPEDAVYLGALDALSALNPNFTFVPTMTDMQNSTKEWIGETGRISNDMISKYVHDRNDAVYYIAGPSAMVAAMQKMLEEGGVSSDDIRIEEFTGY